MRTIVRFRSNRATYALPVEAVTEVRSAADLTPLPSPRPGVAGVMRRGDEALTVLSVLGDGGAHVIVVEDGDVRFGLLVDAVVGVESIDDVAVGAPPPGQDQEAVAGVLVEDGGVVLLLDGARLRGRLSS
jgi:chemotaxis signal transduction protein